MLPRTVEQVTMAIDNYVVAAQGSRIVACAALDEYSPSLAEVSSVAVAKSEHGKGLGTEVVLGVERLARARDITEIISAADKRPSQKSETTAWVVQPNATWSRTAE